MSGRGFPARGRGFGGGGGRGGRDGRGGGFGRGRGGRGGVEEGPPAEIVELGSFMHSAENEMVCRLTHAMIPYFNAGIYLENKAKVGKVEEVFGPINKVYFTIKPDPGVDAASFKADDKVYIGSDKLLPLSRFTGEQKSGGGGRGGGGRGGGRGPPGRGFGGRGGGRGGPGGGRTPFAGRGGSSFGGRGGGGGGRGGFGRGGR
eukprot:gene4936-5419_t